MTALLNGGLEDGSTPLTVVDGGYAGYFAAPLVRDNTDSYDGTWSINTTTNSAVNVQGILWFAPQKAVVPAGVLHTAGIAVKGPNGTVVRVGGRNCNPDGSYQSEEASFVDVTLTGAWQYFTVKPYSVAADTIPGLQVRLITAASGVLLKFDNAGVWLPTRADIKPSAGIASGTGTAYNPSATASGNALAGVATGTGVAQTPRVDIKANTGVAAGAGTAQTPRADVQANAGVATGAGTAYNPTASTSGNANANAGVATGAGTAYNPTISASGSALAGVATGVGTAQAPSTSVKANAGVATGTGTAQTPRADVKPGAGVATGAGTAYNPSTTASGNALAGVATGVGTAYNPTGSSANATYANAGSAAGTGTAYGPSVSISPSPQVAWGRATNLLTPNQSAIEVDASGWTSSFNPGALPYTMVKATDQIHDKSASLKVSFQGGTGAAQFNININPVASIPVVAAEALKGGIWIRSNVARTVSLNIDWFNSVPSYIISDTQTLALLANTWTQFAVSAPYRSPGAFASFTVSSNPVAGDILWIADGEIYKVQTAKASILPSAGLASGTGTAQTPRADIKANAGVATGVGTAYNPTASIGGAPANAPAGVATGAGTALGPTVKISANTQVATAVGTAYNPDISISTRANAGVATGAGIAYNPGVSLSKSGAAGVATATGTAYPAKPSIGAAAGCATGVGTAYDAMANIFIVGPSPDERVYHVVREHRIFVVERERRGIHVPFDPNRTTIVTERQGAHV
jgi:hypothetical protein